MKYSIAYFCCCLLFCNIKNCEILHILVSTVDIVSIPPEEHTHMTVCSWPLLFHIKMTSVETTGKT